MSDPVSRGRIEENGPVIPAGQFKRLKDVHRCDGRCVCPVHGTPLLYSAAVDMHACQDPDCVHAHGVDLDDWNLTEMRRAVAARGQQHPELWHGNWAPPDGYAAGE